MCDFLTVVDSDIVQVALNALENILKAGEKFTARPNPYAMAIEECGGKFFVVTFFPFYVNVIIPLKVWIKSNIYNHMKIVIFIINHFT